MIDAAFDWAPALAPLAVFTLLLYVPGGVALWVAGLRPAAALALAPLVSTATVSAAAVLYSALGVRFGWAAVLLVSLATWVLVGLGRFAARRRLPRLAMPRWSVPSPALVSGALVNALAVAWLYLRPNQAADNVAYEYDTIWHFSVIRWFLDTGDFSSLEVGRLDGTVGNSFYPAAWHAFVALTVDATGGTIAAAVHGAVLSLLLVTWPVGMVWLYRTVFPRTGQAGQFAVAALAFIPAVFPIGFVTFGLLYSNLFSYAVLPLALVAVIVLFRGIAGHEWRELRGLALPGAIVIVAIPVTFLFAQPNSAFTMLVLLLPLAYLTIHRALAPARIGDRSRWIRPATQAAFTVVLVTLWIVLHDSSFLERTVNVTTWPAYEAPDHAAGEWLFFGNGTDGQLLLGLMAVAGIAVAFAMRSGRWWVVSWAIVGALYVVCAAAPGNGPDTLRSYLVGFWYTDATRLAAAGAVLALPFIGAAVQTASAALGAFLAAPARRRRMLQAAASLAIVAVVMLVSVRLEGALRARDAQIRTLATASDAQWVSPAEQAFLERVVDTVGTDAVVANNPFDGSAMAYALVDLDVLFKALPGNWMGAPTRAQILMHDRFNELATDPEMCAAVQDLDIEYALVLERGERPVFSDNGERYPGMRITPETPGFEPVLQDGPFALYRVTDCAS